MIKTNIDNSAENPFRTPDEVTMTPDTVRVLTHQETDYTIPRNLIQFEGIQPIAFDGMTLRLDRTSDGIKISVGYEIKSNFHGAYKKRRKEEGPFTIRGSIISFQEKLSWERFEQMSAGCVVRLVDIVKPNAFKSYNALHKLVIDRLVRFTVHLTPEHPAHIEYTLEFKDGLTFKERIKREDATDIYGKA